MRKDRDLIESIGQLEILFTVSDSPRGSQCKCLTIEKHIGTMDDNIESNIRPLSYSLVQRRE